MKRITNGTAVTWILTLILASMLMWGCIPRLRVRRFLPDVIMVASSSDEDGVSGAVVLDTHYVGAADYLVAEASLADSPWVYARLGKLVKYEPKYNTADFILSMDSSEINSSFYAKTRIASTEDLEPQSDIYFFDAKDSEGVHRSPANREEALHGWWINASIISHIQGDVYLVSGDNLVHASAIRIKDDRPIPK